MTENTLSIKMLQIENENETPIESNFNESCNNLEKSDKKQNITDYTEQERNGSSSTNNIYQKKTGDKVQLP